VGRDLLTAPEPAIGEVRAATSVDLCEAIDCVAPRLRRSRSRLDDDIDDVVVHDDAESIAIVEASQGFLNCLLGER
jgi:hypothetical protein